MYTYLPKFEKFLTSPALEDVTAVLSKANKALARLVAIFTVPLGENGSGGLIGGSEALSEVDVTVDLKGEGKAIATGLSSDDSAAEHVKEVGQPTLTNFVMPLEEIIDKVEHKWAVFSEMTVLMASARLNEIKNEAAPLVAEFFTMFGQNDKVAQIYHYFAEHEKALGLSGAERQAVANALVDFELSGVYLSPSARAKFREVDKELARLMTLFSNHLIEDSAKKELIVTDERLLQGLDEGEKMRARKNFLEKYDHGVPSDDNTHRANRANRAKGASLSLNNTPNDNDTEQTESSTSIASKTDSTVEPKLESKLEPKLESKLESKNAIVPEDKAGPGYIFPMADATYINFMKQVSDSSLRQRYYQLYVTRSSEGKLDNTPIIEQILKLRRNQAELLSLTTFEEKVLKQRLVKTAEEVFAFLEGLLKTARPHALSEKETLENLAREMTGAPEIFPWDIPYYSQKYKEQHFALREDEIKQYFPVETVLAGLLEVVRRVFGCRFVCEKGRYQADQSTGREPLKKDEPPERLKEHQSSEELKQSTRLDVPVWHEDVMFYTVFDDQTGEKLGHLYMDLFARKHKQGGAWMDSISYKKRTKNELAIVFLVGNFMPPDEKGISLLTHRDIETLFHEMGHCLHHLLTKVELRSVAGLNGVPLEGIEFPSQFLERWAWDERTLQLLSKHIKTGESLPSELCKKMIAAKNALSALSLMAQIEYSMIDMALHKYYPNRYLSIKGQNAEQADDYIASLRRSVSIWEYPDYVKFQNQFLHIFSHGYAAGYYTYLYSNMYAADAFEVFKENDIFDATLGHKFRASFFERGGSEDFRALYIKFRGREPTSAALLKDLAIA